MRNQRSIRPQWLLIAVFFFACASAHAGSSVTEIEYLLTSVGTSGCEFFRNGKSHTSQKAEDHLRMKYEPRKKYAKNAEQFIARFASKSSLSGKPYLMQCDGEKPINASVWLQQKLNGFREGEWGRTNPIAHKPLKQEQ